MTTETYWVVRNDKGESLTLLDTWSTRDASRMASRREAEALAAQHGGYVVEVTVTERRVGLRWEGGLLYDGDDCLDGFTRWSWQCSCRFGIQRGAWANYNAARAAHAAHVRQILDGGAR